MDINEKFFKYCKKRTDSYFNNLNKICISYDMDVIHDFRSDIKKLRSLFALSKMIDRNFAQKSQSENFIPNVRKYFKVTGRIREGQLILFHLGNSGLSEDILTDLNASVLETIKKHQEEISVLINRSSLTEHLSLIIDFEKLSRSYKGKEILKKCNKLFQKEIRTVISLSADFRDTEVFHKIRKHLKNIVLTGNILVKFNRDKKFRQFLRLCRSEEIEIGEWHDNVIFDQYLQEQLSININKNEYFISSLIKLKAETQKKNFEMLLSLYKKSGKGLLLKDIIQKKKTFRKIRKVFL